MVNKLIEVKDLKIYFKENDFTAVKSISFDILLRNFCLVGAVVVESRHSKSIINSTFKLTVRWSGALSWAESILIIQLSCVDKTLS